MSSRELENYRKNGKENITYYYYLFNQMVQVMENESLEGTNVTRKEILNIKQIIQEGYSRERHKYVEELLVGERNE